MIPWKFFDLTARDQTGVLLLSIHRMVRKVQNNASIEVIPLIVPAENGFLLTSASAWCLGNPIGVAAQQCELNVLDASGNRISSLADVANGGNLAAGNRGAVSWVGSPIMVVGPGMQIELRAIFSAADPVNEITGSINGVLIPRGTMAFQT